jgi:ParB family chromosome partitioning protein
MAKPKIGNLQGLSALAKAATGKKGREVITVSVDDVESKEQIRKKFKNLEELAASMKAEGQQSPIIVYPKNDSGRYVIQKGERRWRALKLAGMESIDLIVNDKELSELDETAGELIENIQREDLAPMEIAHALKKFVDEGWKQKKIAERLGKNAIFVSTHLSLLKLPECVQELYNKDVCGDTETLNNLRLLFDLNEERCRHVCAVALDEGISRKQSRDLLNDAKRVKEELKAGKTRAVASPEQDSTGTPETNEQPLGDSSDTAPEASAPNGDGTDETQEEGDAGEQLEGTEKDATSKQPPKAKPEPKHQDAMPPIPEDKDWRFTEPKELIVVVNLITDNDVKRGILLLDRVCKDPKEVWVKVVDGSKEKSLKVLTSDIELVSIET